MLKEANDEANVPQWPVVLYHVVNFHTERFQIDGIKVYYTKNAYANMYTFRQITK